MPVEAGARRLSGHGVACRRDVASMCAAPSSSAMLETARSTYAAAIDGPAGIRGIGHPGLAGCGVPREPVSHCLPGRAGGTRVPSPTHFAPRRAVIQRRRSKSAGVRFEFGICSSQSGSGNMTGHAASSAVRVESGFAKGHTPYSAAGRRTRFAGRPHERRRCHGGGRRLAKRRHRGDASVRWMDMPVAGSAGPARRA